MFQYGDKHRPTQVVDNGMSIEKIYSKQNPSQVLHIVVDTKKVIEQRQDLTPSDQWVQVSLIPLVGGQKIRPHFHQRRDDNIPKATITQESWFVIRGSIFVRLYDVDQTVIYESNLNEGFMLITFYGGHSMEALDRGAIVMETKNGPYSGPDYIQI